MVSAAQVSLVATATAVTGVLGYAVYFDYKRRNDATFRKAIRKQHKAIREEAEQKESAQRAQDERRLRAALAELKDDELPGSPEQAEAFFQEQVAEGELQAAKGPASYVDSAIHFYRALRVYPNPVELLMIYKRVCPEAVFNLVIQLTTMNPGPSGAPASRPAAANLEAVDDAAPAEEVVSEGNGSASTGNGAEWDRLSDEARP
ncbi:mitochondrial import receptor subunit tom20 [Cryptotrichosporon argae]